MTISFEVVGGKLTISKDAFVLEMLNARSVLRPLLNWKGSEDITLEGPIIEQSEAGDNITVYFDHKVCVSIGESPRDVLVNIKKKYKEKVKGRIACRGRYFGNVFYFELDLNREDDKIEYISNQI